MKNTTRELLLITKAARHWNKDFDEQVDVLMRIVGEVDKDENVARASELMDVYHHNLSTVETKKGKRAKSTGHRPFAFIAYRN